jgi:hypothetical protein
MTAVNLTYPMFAMVVLTTVILVILFRSRMRAVRERKVTMGYFKIYQGQVEPEYAAKPARQFSNLFEVPTLFYAACLTAMITQQSGQAIQVLAWVYVAARVIHAGIHLGSNKIQLRITAYFIGWLALLVMWIYLVVGVATRS